MVRFTDAYRLGIGEAFAGSTEEDLDAGSIRLSLDDSGMSNPLLVVLDDLCTRPGTTCTVWLEGLWGPLLPDLPGVRVEEAGGSPTRWPFAVLKVDGLVQASSEQGEPVRVFVEDDRPVP